MDVVFRRLEPGSVISSGFEDFVPIRLSSEYSIAYQKLLRARNQLKAPAAETTQLSPTENDADITSQDPDTQSMQGGLTVVPIDDNDNYTPSRPNYPWLEWNKDDNLSHLKPNPLDLGGDPLPCRPLHSVGAEILTLLAGDKSPVARPSRSTTDPLPRDPDQTNDHELGSMIGRLEFTASSQPKRTDMKTDKVCETVVLATLDALYPRLPKVKAPSIAAASPIVAVLQEIPHYWAVHSTSDDHFASALHAIAGGAANALNYLGRTDSSSSLQAEQQIHDYVRRLERHALTLYGTDAHVNLAPRDLLRLLQMLSDELEVIRGGWDVIVIGITRHTRRATRVFRNEYRGNHLVVLRYDGSHYEYFADVLSGSKLCNRQHHAANALQVLDRSPVISESTSRGSEESRKREGSPIASDRVHRPRVGGLTGQHPMSLTEALLPTMASQPVESKNMADQTPQPAMYLDETVRKGRSKTKKRSRGKSNKAEKQSPLLSKAVAEAAVTLRELIPLLMEFPPHTRTKVLGDSLTLDENDFWVVQPCLLQRFEAPLLCRLNVWSNAESQPDAPAKFHPLQDHAWRTFLEGNVFLLQPYTVLLFLMDLQQDYADLERRKLHINVETKKDKLLANSIDKLKGLIEQVHGKVPKAVVKVQLEVTWEGVDSAGKLSSWTDYMWTSDPQQTAEEMEVPQAGKTNVTSRAKKVILSSAEETYRNKGGMPSELAVCN